MVQAAKISEVLEGAKLLSSPQGQIRGLESASSLFVLDFPDRVQMIRDFATAIDRAAASLRPPSEVVQQQQAGLQVAYLAPHYIPAGSAQGPLESILSKEGRLAIMEDERRIVVVDYPIHLQAAREVLAQIDVPRPQVRIHAFIYDISLEDLEVLGFNWNHAVKGRLNSSGEPQTVFSLDSITQVPFQASAAGSAMTLMSLSRKFDITSVIEALQTANDARPARRPQRHGA